MMKTFETPRISFASKDVSHYMQEMNELKIVDNNNWNISWQNKYKGKGIQ